MYNYIYRNQDKLKSILILGIYLLLMIIFAVGFNNYGDKNSLQTIVSNSGRLGIFVYFIVEVIYVTFTPLLNTGILIASGLLFGGHLGFLINFFSTAVGLLLIVFLVKKYGRPLLHKIITPKYYDRYDLLTQKIGPMILLIVYVLPFTPDDELTYIVAAGPIGIKRFILPILFGTLAKSAYSYIGDQGMPGLAIALYARFWMLIVGVIVVGIQEYIYKKSQFSMIS